MTAPAGGQRCARRRRFLRRATTTRSAERVIVAEQRQQPSAPGFGSVEPGHNGGLRIAVGLGKRDGVQGQWQLPRATAPPGPSTSCASTSGQTHPSTPLPPWSTSLNEAGAPTRGTLSTRPARRWLTWPPGARSSGSGAAFTGRGIRGSGPPAGDRSGGKLQNRVQRCAAGRSRRWPRRTSNGRRNRRPLANKLEHYVARSLVELNRRPAGAACLNRAHQRLSSMLGCDHVQERSCPCSK